MTFQVIEIYQLMEAGCGVENVSKPPDIFGARRCADC